MNAATDQRTCIHCGTPFRPTPHRMDFCCAGCQFVHRLIAEQGLGQFYDLQEGGAAPVAGTVFQRRDYDWLREMVKGGGNALELDVQGLSCLGCAWLVERLFQRQPGAQTIQVDPAMGRLRMQWEGDEFDPAHFAEELQRFGYLLGPLGAAAEGEDRALGIRLGWCGALAMNVMLFTFPRYLGMESSFAFAPLFERLAMVLGTLSFLIGGSYFILRSWRSLRQGVLHMDVPIAIGLVAAYVGSLVAWKKGAEGLVYFDFVSTFTFLMLAGRWLQQKVIVRNRRQLLQSQVTSVTVQTPEGGRMEAGDLVVGSIYHVKPGQMVPVRSLLRSPEGLLGMEWINGESEAMTAQRGRLLAAGAVNLGAKVIELEARETWAGSLLARLLQTNPTGSTRDAQFERFVRNYMGVVVLLGMLGAAGWWWYSGSGLLAMQVLISVLVVSCPCASGVALPLARDFAASRLRQLGVYVRNGEIWSRLHHVRKIIFDKTGTLTMETVSLLNPETLGELTAEERSVLLRLVQDNRHPVSCSLREHLLAEGEEASESGAVKETIGFGVETEAGGVVWKLGRRTWVSARPLVASGDCYFTRNGELLAAFRFGEMARDDARTELRELREQGMEVSILSGDRAEKVEAMARRLELPPEQCHGELTPQQKAEWVQRLDAGDTVYIGDGANDSLAFDAASIRGTPAVDRGLLEQKADFYFLGRSLSGVRALLEMGGRWRRCARGVVGFAISYNVVAVALSLAGKMSPLLAAVLMPASSVVSVAIVLAAFGRARTIRATHGTGTAPTTAIPPNAPLDASAPLRC